MNPILIRLVKASIVIGAQHYWRRHHNPILQAPEVSALANVKQPSGLAALPNDNNADKALRALTTLQHYAVLQGNTYESFDRDTFVIDLLADLMHLVSDGAPCVDALDNHLRVAEMHYEEELEEEFQHS